MGGEVLLLALSDVIGIVCKVLLLFLIRDPCWATRHSHKQGLSSEKCLDGLHVALLLLEYVVLMEQ